MSIRGVGVRPSIMRLIYKYKIKLKKKNNVLSKKRNFFHVPNNCTLLSNMFSLFLSSTTIFTDPDVSTNKYNNIIPYDWAPNRPFELLNILAFFFWKIKNKNLK